MCAVRGGALQLADNRRGGSGSHRWLHQLRGVVWCMHGVGCGWLANVHRIVKYSFPW